MSITTYGFIGMLQVFFTYRYIDTYNFSRRFENNSDVIAAVKKVNPDKVNDT